MTIVFRTEPATPPGVTLEFISAQQFVSELQATFGLGRTGIWDGNLTTYLQEARLALPNARALAGTAALQALVDNGGTIPEAAAIAAMEAYALRKGVPAAMLTVLGVSGWRPFLYETMGPGVDPEAGPPGPGTGDGLRPREETILGMPQPVAIGVGVALGVAALIGIAVLIKKAAK